MPYYYECDICHVREGIHDGESYGYERSCLNCGFDGCDECINDDGLCPNCSALDKPEGEA